MVLGIYCAGGLGREVYIIAKKLNAIEHRWEKIVFIDDAASSETLLGVPIWMLQRALAALPEIEVVIASGEPAIRESLYQKLKDNRIPLATLIHPDVYIDETTKIGEGCVISEGVTITSCVSVGGNCCIEPHVTVGHDAQIGDHSIICSNAVISGNNRIGKCFFLGAMGGTKDELTIGNDVICSAGAVVFRDLPDAVIVAGNPARIIGKNEERRVFK